MDHCRQRQPANGRRIRSWLDRPDSLQVNPLGPALENSGHGSAAPAQSSTWRQSAASRR
jgi:hypothetical protein